MAYKHAASGVSQSKVLCRYKATLAAAKFLLTRRWWLGFYQTSKKKKTKKIIKSFAAKKQCQQQNARTRNCNVLITRRNVIEIPPKKKNKLIVFAQANRLLRNDQVYEDQIAK